MSPGMLALFFEGFWIKILLRGNEFGASIFGQQKHFTISESSVADGHG